MDNGYNNYGQQNNMNMGQYGMNQKTPGFGKYMFLSIFQMLCCCQITGIIALVFTLLANSAFKIGNIVEYQTKMKNAKTSLTVGWIIGVLVIITTIILSVISIMIEA